MGFFKQLFGGKPEDPEEKQRNDEARRFDVLKYDGVRALQSRQAYYAVECFRHALAMKEDLEVRDYLSQALVQVGALPEAYEQLQRLAEVQPDNLLLFVRMANVAYMMEDYEALDAAIERAVQISPDTPEVYMLSARGNMSQGNWAKAEEMFAKALDLNPDYAEVYLLRGDERVKSGNADGAEADVAWLLERAPENEDVLLLKARVEHLLGHDAEAIDWYGKVVDANPFHIEAYQERMDIRKATGDEAGAEEDRTKLAELRYNRPLAPGEGGIEKKVKDAYDSINPLGL